MDKRKALQLSNQSLVGMKPVLLDHNQKFSYENRQNKNIDTKHDLDKKCLSFFLPKDLSLYLTIKANQSQKSIQLFFEDLIKNYFEQSKETNPFHVDLQKYNCTKNSFVRRSVHVSEDTKLLLKKSASNLGMNTVSYIYYMVDLEKLNDPDYKL